ncbi:hypothetical protein A3L09_06760 [Thermococcus profundus]|uniref:Uncharacterized protein n=1 Tax=Thermococcus profundus TaxID=49899 RepID=A0A2Z2MM41_THEPR|nr:hypothetical protein [Thermococcus profundus]ASJ02978.1 hypothetical protein A3L09_06760 [Thermococcus profundus]
MKRKYLLWGSLIIIGLVGLSALVYSESTLNLRPTGYYSSSGEHVYPTPVPIHGEAWANFSNAFVISVLRKSGRIIVRAEPKEDYTIESLKVLIYRQYGNDLYVDTGFGAGSLKVYREKTRNGWAQVVEATPQKDLGKGSVELIFMDRTPKNLEKLISLRVEVVAKKGFRRYRGEWDFTVPNPSE